MTVSTTEPTRDGYTFTGWNTAVDGLGTTYTGGSTYTLPNSGTDTLYPVGARHHNNHNHNHDGSASNHDDGGSNNHDGSASNHDDGGSNNYDGSANNHDNGGSHRRRRWLRQ